MPNETLDVCGMVLIRMIVGHLRNDACDALASFNRRYPPMCAAAISGSFAMCRLRLTKSMDIFL
jgi:hypothetical protein